LVEVLIVVAAIVLHLAIICIVLALPIVRIKAAPLAQPLAVVTHIQIATNVIETHEHTGDFTSSGCVNPHFAVESSDGFANHKTRKTTG
jgi:hypothetical protein